MHSFRTKRHIFWLKVSALHFVILILVACAVVVFAFLAFLHVDGKFMTWSLIGMVGCVWVGLVYRLAAGITKCPLCQSEPMVSKKCRKHRDAVKLMGSYRLMVASTTLLLNRFRCPYCGESSRCRVRSQANDD
jgi:predicted RNA-binding Zn-ribbon protein involved in translation (DUF1610 family)